MKPFTAADQSADWKKKLTNNLALALALCTKRLDSGHISFDHIFQVPGSSEEIPVPRADSEVYIDLHTIYYNNNVAIYY
jgi:hypothetical protein